jgi:RNA polymerase primary sigma factor
MEKNEKSLVLPLHWKNIRKIAVMNKEINIEIDEEIKKKVPNARQKLVLYNLRFAYQQSRKYLGTGAEPEDLLQASYLGLINASLSYDPERKNGFLAHAVINIKQAILEYLADNLRTLRLPSNVVFDLGLIKKAQNKLEIKTEGYYTVEDVAKECNLAPFQVRDVMNGTLSIGSLDQPVGDEENSTVIDLVVTDNFESVNEKREESLRLIKFLLTSISERDQKIVKMFYGIDGELEHMSEDIAEKIGLSKLRVNQILKDSLEFMKNKMKKAAKSVK